MNARKAQVAIIVLAASVSVLAFGRDPGTFYVDADHGKDTWDGSTDFAHRDEANDIGPRKTLVGIMEVANTSGDVVYAAAGTYAEGALARKDTEATLNRVIIPAGVRLESLEGAKRTFIVGAPAKVARDGAAWTVEAPGGVCARGGELALTVRPRPGAAGCRSTSAT